MKYDWNLEKIKELVATSVNFTEVLEGLNIPRQGNNSKTLRNILDKNSIDYSHFTGRARQYNIEKIPIEDYLSNKCQIPTAKLKTRLIKEGLKENKCEICGISEWQGNPIVCQLHHIDGNHLNNNIDNLQILCPNCHSQTSNFCGKINKEHKYFCEDCGKPITRGARYCTTCAAKHKQKVVKPDKEELILKYKELKSVTQMGKFYGVSDNAVRKWFKSYNLSAYKKDLQNL